MGDLEIGLFKPCFLLWALAFQDYERIQRAWLNFGIDYKTDSYLQTSSPIQVIHSP